MKRKLIIISLCILELLFGTSCSQDTPKTAAENLSEPIVPPTNQSIVRTSKVVVATQANGGSLISAKISEGAEPLLQYPYAQPLPEWLDAVKPHDKALLLFRYRNEAHLTNKYTLTIALSLVGDKEVAEEFIKTLIGTPFAHTINFNEEVVLDRTITSLGMIARNEESLLPFLRQAADPRFWKQNAPWKSHAGESQFGVFAGRAMAALAISGAPDARDIFEQVKANPYVTDAEGSGWALNSSVVTAVFLADFLEERGFDALKAMYAHQRSRDYWHLWTGTENGKKWVSWSRQWRKDHPKESGVPQP